METLHFLCTGGTGSGKSVAFAHAMKSTRDRKMPAIVADPGGEFLAKFCQPGIDVLLNPFDSRALAWSPLSEMRQVYDCQRIAFSLIPEGSGESAEWNSYARNVLTAVLEAAFFDLKSTNQTLLEMLFLDDVKTLAQRCAGGPAARLFAEGNERMLGSVLGIVSTYCSPLQYLDPRAGRSSFSIRNHIDSARSWIFLNFSDDQLSTLRPLIAAWIDIAASQVLMKPAVPNGDDRFFFFLDEFATLGKINSIEPLLTKSRKNGGSVFLGLQSVSQIRDCYGRERAQTLLSCLSNVLVLRQPDAESAEYFARQLGKAEIMRTNLSAGSGGNILTGDDTKWSQQITETAVVMPAELRKLESRFGVLDLAGDIPPTPVQLDIIDLPKVTEHFKAKTVQPIKMERTDTPPADQDLKKSTPSPTSDPVKSDTVDDDLPVLF